MCQPCAGVQGKGRSQLDDFEQSLKVARIESVQPHPNADRLKVCSVNTGSQTFKVGATAAACWLNFQKFEGAIGLTPSVLQVVTNAPNAAEGKLVVFAVCGNYWLPPFRLTAPSTDQLTISTLCRVLGVFYLALQHVWSRPP